MCRLYANTTPFYIRNLSVCRFWYPQESWNQSPSSLRDDCVFTYIWGKYFIQTKRRHKLLPFCLAVLQRASRSWYLSWLLNLVQWWMVGQDIVSPFFFFWSMPTVCGSSHARNRTHTTAVTMPDQSLTLPGTSLTWSWSASSPTWLKQWLYTVLYSRSWHNTVSQL